LLPTRATCRNTRDPDYQAILSRIVAASQRHHAEKRFDMPGFRPNVYYFRKLQSYGVVPPDLIPDAPIDIYAADQAYWKSFWHRPDKSK